MDPSRVADRLAEIGLEVLVGVASRPGATLRRFGPREVLWTAGSPSRGLYVVLRGRVRVVRARGGRQHLVHVAGPGSVMGEVPLLDGGGYPATALAAESTECLAVPVAEVLAAMEDDGALGYFLAGGLARRVRVLVVRLEARTLGSVRSRVAASLMGLTAGRDPEVVRLPSPQVEWAEDLGTVRETLARELARLVEEDVLDRAGRGRVRIVDEARLERIALGEDQG